MSALQPAPAAAIRAVPSNRWAGSRAADNASPSHASWLPTNGRTAPS